MAVSVKYEARTLHAICSHIIIILKFIKLHTTRLLLLQLIMLRVLQLLYSVRIECYNQ